MKGKIVVKIGGSNLKSAESIQKIASVIQQYDQSPIVVVSAFYGITNLLIQVLDHALTNSDQVSVVIEEIRYGKGTSFTKLKIHRLHFLSSNLKQKIKLPCLGKTQRKWSKKLNLFVNGEQENTPLQNYAEALE